MTELQLGKYEFFPYDDELSEKLKELEESGEENSDIDVEELLAKLSKETKRDDKK